MTLVYEKENNKQTNLHIYNTNKRGKHRDARSPELASSLLAENLLISAADFRYFLLILTVFRDYLSASLLSVI